jgi:ADP-L-glycero-D-manno-heptose 6-epimerase
MNVVVTGGAGFIGSSLIWKLNQEGVEDILVVDALGTGEKWKNLVGLRFQDAVHKNAFLQTIKDDSLAFHPDAIVHLGACSATTERDADYLLENNYRYTRLLADWCLQHGTRFVYASSAATYGDGSDGFSDDDTVTPNLTPLNMYGYSKHMFDLHALKSGYFDRIAGVKFFNVFGPNEYHKDGMVSMVLRSFRQIQESGTVRLFKSDRPEYSDGGQKRDFVYVKDCVDVLWWLMNTPSASGLFNLGTGQARTWVDLVNAVFKAQGLAPSIEFIDMPAILKDKYQYFTQADMYKLRSAGYGADFHTLEQAVHDYVSNYLVKDSAHLGAR